MPDYIYCCFCGFESEHTHGMDDNPAIACAICGKPMHRKPQLIPVNWGGLKPSQGEIHPNIRHLIDDAPRRREEEKQS